MLTGHGVTYLRTDINVVSLEVPLEIGGILSTEFVAAFTAVSIYDAFCLSFCWMIFKVCP